MEQTRKEYGECIKTIGSDCSSCKSTFKEFNYFRQQVEKAKQKCNGSITPRQSIGNSLRLPNQVVKSPRERMMESFQDDGNVGPNITSTGSIVKRKYKISGPIVRKNPKLNKDEILNFFNQVNPLIKKLAEDFFQDFQK